MRAGLPLISIVKLRAKLVVLEYQQDARNQKRKIAHGIGRPLCAAQKIFNKISQKKTAVPLPGHALYKKVGALTIVLEAPCTIFSLLLL
jgi:hypothetical protein